MNTKTKILALVLALTLVLAVVFAITAAANEGTETDTTVEATITAAPNGATGIASMTFDDGKWNTAQLLNTIFKDYDGIKASLMISGTLGGKDAALWNGLFAEGYLVPESHSMSHMNLGNGTAGDALSIEEKRAEICGSYDFLKSKFPNYDILAYAIPNSNYDATELGLVNERFYVARTGLCVLYNSGQRGKMQSLNPTFGTEYGSWMNTYMVRMQPNASAYAETNSTANIIKYLDQCVADGGWFISMSHGVSPSDGTPEVTEAQLREILDAMQAYVDAGKLWVTSMTEATKYIRERQNSSVSAYERGGVIYVDVKMASTTADGLELSSDVFDMPLTVKVTVPTTWKYVSYSLNGVTQTVRTRGNAAGRYAYVNVVPNSDTVAVTDGTPDDERVVVGSYTQPEGTWKPDEGSGVKFAVWDSEDDFLAGVAPTEDNIYTTNVLDENNVGLKRGDTTVKSNYVHLFDDCVTTTNSQLYVGFKQSLVINLGGHSLTSVKGILIGDSSGSRTQAKLTIKNGTFYHNGGNVQCRGESELRYENVYYQVGGACMNYDDVARLVEFKDCTLNVKGAAHFALGTRAGNWTPCQMTFINTDVITADANEYLFRINLTADATTPINIRFDKDSSITRPSGKPLIVFNRGYNPDNDSPIYIKSPHYLIFEEGCEVSEAIAPVYGRGYSYTVQHYNQSSGKFGPNGSNPYTSDGQYLTSFDSGFTDGTLFVKVVKPGTNVMVKWKGVTTDDGIVALEKAISTAWEPTAEYAGITYGLWATEADFLLGKAPTKWSTSTTFNNTDLGIDTSGANISGTPVVGYMRFYADLTSAYKDASNSATKLQIITPAARSFVMDLNGFTFNDAVGIRPGGSSTTHPDAYFTVKNGIFQRKGGQFQIRQDVKVTFDKVLVVNNVSNFFYGCAPDLLRFKDSVFLNLTGYGLHMGAPYTNHGYAVAEIVFENSDIMYMTAPVEPFFQFSDSVYGDGIYDIIFDQNSSINIDFADFTLARLTETYDYAKDTVYNNMKIRIIIEDGFTVPKGATLTYNCTYVTVDKAASQEASAKASKEATDLENAKLEAQGKEPNANVVKTVTVSSSSTLASSTAADSKFSWLVYAPGDRSNGSSKYYSLEKTTGHYNATDRLIANLGTFYQYVEFDANGNILNVWPIGSVFGYDVTAPIPHANGATFKFFHDTILREGGTYQNYNVTFDLNGCTLTRTGTGHFQIGHSRSAVFEERLVKFINSSPDKRGTLDFSNGAAAIQNRPGSTVVFENIDVITKGSLFTDYGAVSMTFTNVNFTSPSASAVVAGGYSSLTYSGFTEKGGVREFVFDNCTFDKVRPISWNHSIEDNVRVTFKGGCVIDNASFYPIHIENAGVKKLELIVEEGTVLYNPNSSIVHLSSTAVTEVTGGKITALEIVDGKYVVSAKPETLKGSDLQSNLTLYTDFQLNFFANPDIITGINMNGVALESMEFEGRDKYTIKGITPNTAADDILLFVYATEGEKNYVLPLTYSILTYSEQIIAKTNDDSAKKLVSAAMDYVKAAYVYDGKAAPVFEGVEYDKYTAGADAHNVPSAIRGAQLDLDSGFKLRFNIKEGYNGTIVVNGTSYEVKNGAYNGITYIEVNMRAYDLYDTKVAITADGVTGYYALANYVVFANEDGKPENLKNLANALYNYAANANSYKNNLDN